MISDLFEPGWKVQTKSQSKTVGVSIDTWATSDIIEAHVRMLKSSEITKGGKLTTMATHRIYTNSGNANITETARMVDPDGRIYRVLGPVDNPHDLDEFVQIDVIRDEVEKDDE